MPHDDLHTALLSVDDLRISFDTSDGPAYAVDGVSFSISRGEIFCLVGESGCGKSATALSILQLIASPPGKIASGSITFNGENLLAKTESDMEKIRGNQIGMVFQEPMTSLNPVLRIGAQVAEPLLWHRGLSHAQAQERAIELLGQVGIPDPAARYTNFPHQMSGGMRQRVMIAMAMACQPDLIIADEPTTALDVTIQHQVLSLLKGLSRDNGNALLLITHDLAVVQDMADRVAVMYSGKIIEQAPAGELFDKALHPYTQGLMNSRPKLDPQGRHKRLPTIPGTVPNPRSRPQGCSFQDRCPHKDTRCTQAPPLYTKNKHSCRCWLYA